MVSKQKFDLTSAKMGEEVMVGSLFTKGSCWIKAETAMVKSGEGYRKKGSQSQEAN